MTLMPSNPTKPHISLDMFRKLVITLSPTELAQLPVHKLPRNIPEEIIGAAPLDMQDLLRDLAVQMEIDQVGTHVEDLDRYGKTLANALQKAETARTLEGHHVLGKTIGELATLLHDWKSSDNLDSRTQTTSKFDTLIERFTSATDLAEDLRTELAEFNRAEYLICTEGRKAGIHRGRLTDAVAQIREKIQPAQEQMSQFNTLRLTLCQQEMNNLRLQVNVEQVNQDDLQAQIDALHKDLEKRQSIWGKALSKYRSTDDYTEIQQQITRLVAAKNANEIIVPEVALQRWLDSVVDVSLDLTSQQQCANLLPEVRANLFWLLQRYSHQQQSGARQIARNPFTQVNPKNAIEFMLLSERFIVEYFAHKQHDDPFWFGSSIHERREELEKLRSEILTELKENLDGLDDS